MLNIESSIQYLKGIGSKRAYSFSKLGVNSLYDLLSFFPSAYQDRTRTVPVENLIYNNHQGCIFVKIGNSYQKRLSANLSILDIEVFDNKFHGYLRFFRNNNSRFRGDILSYLKKIFVKDYFTYIYGEAKEEYGKVIITAIDYEIVKDEFTTPLHFKRIIPIYAATEGLKQKFIRESLKTTLNSYTDFYPDLLKIIPDSYNIHKMEISAAIKKIHFPESLQEAEFARQSFALQEFLILETALLLSRNNLLQKNKIQEYKIKKTLLSAFKNNLDFEFTKDQKKAINDIFLDMQSKKTMNRMLMGDVGSGKTVVALSAILLAIENGYQAMIIAPTEVLAEQHYLTISNILKGLDVTISLLTSSLLKTQKEKKRLLESLKNGQTQIAIGTHSLIEDRIKFKNLSLVVIDEQHRFGVTQKFAALYKAKSPDVLMMTATPIPRALAMTVYGEIDITTIKHLPTGTIPVKTFLVTEEEAYSSTIKELKKGNQAYIVYPIIEESEKLDLKSAIQDFEKLSKDYFKDFKIALLHGRMKPQEKNLIMRKFKNKEFDVLVATTVIEVGIDVPNSTVIIIHNAERFGLSALHQLRGRVGRSTKQSYAYLISSSNSQNANERLSIMTSTNDGFQIAQKDLEMRGPGELMGTTQHGFPTFKAGNLATDVDIIELSKNIAKNILKDDPHLLKQENFLLKNLITKHFSSKIKFIGVG
ncbi:MAG: ATP-dependent DNA helicase RecG [Endomicrobium sp.]|jgi:ATP-dependent DNA helicase RecG|uniref:ATP-dependent DNA helicase RecG n=1 Tax=Candidatus Endomicrobiellum cubanum TaxID=3242325 RepID=UPI002838D050|nr:ATP-dependent DNA helicase RecG [Endomicrobium sp.]MDR2395105.1 ATP-dependent DNA helicase RecG [Endomicrobium sp.]